MNKHGLWVIVVAIVIPLIALLIFERGVEKNASEQTLSYLTEEHGYDEADIASIEVDYSPLNKLMSYDEYTIRVNFKDDPDAQYYFALKDTEVVPTGFAGEPLHRTHAKMYHGE